MTRSAYRHKVLYSVFVFSTSCSPVLYVVYVYGSCSTNLAGYEVIEDVVKVLHIDFGVLLHYSVSLMI